MSLSESSQRGAEHEAAKGDAITEARSAESIDVIGLGAMLKFEAKVEGSYTKWRSPIVKCI